MQILIEGSKFPNFHTSSILIVTPKVNLIYDPGFPYDKTMLLKRLNENNLLPTDIDYIVLSHWHIDHCGSIDLFQKAKIVVSTESIIAIREGIKGVNNAEKSSEFPIDYLGRYLQNEMNIKEMSDTAKVRAMANIVYRNKSLWLSILEKYQSGNVIEVNENDKVVLDGVIISKYSAHTKGDLVVKIVNNQENLLVGDIIPNNDFQMDNLPMLTEDKENYAKAIKEILKKGRYIVPGHSKGFYVV